MGTRNLTCVVYKGEYKVAKYGQWDGYRNGLGASILTFLRDKFNRAQFIAGLEKLTTPTEAEFKQMWVDCGAAPDSDMVTFDVSDKFKNAHPELSRDTSGGMLLQLIQDGVAKFTCPEVSFAADSLFCEWAYVLDLDQNTFEVYEGFNKSPLGVTERFAGIAMEPLKAGETRKYYQVRLLRSYSLRRLPTAKTMCKVTSWSTRNERSKSRVDKMSSIVASV